MGTLNSMFVYVSQAFLSFLGIFLVIYKLKLAVSWSDKVKAGMLCQISQFYSISQLRLASNTSNLTAPNQQKMPQQLLKLLIVQSANPINFCQVQLSKKNGYAVKTSFFHFAVTSQKMWNRFFQSLFKCDECCNFSKVMFLLKIIDFNN